MVTLAFYKYKGDWTDKVIRWYTHSPYSHTEMVIDGVWYSSSPRDGKVRRKVIIPKEGHWDFIEIPCSLAQKNKMKAFFESQMDKRYDLLGIALSQVIPLNIQDPNKWFCSEICSKSLMVCGIMQTGKPAQWYSPGRLFNFAKLAGVFKCG